MIHDNAHRNGGSDLTSFKDVPVPDRPALRNTHTKAPTQAAYELRSTPAAACPAPDSGPPSGSGAAGRSPWDDVFTVPAALLDTYPFLEGVKA